MALSVHNGHSNSLLVARLFTLFWLDNTSNTANRLWQGNIASIIVTQLRTHFFLFPFHRSNIIDWRQDDSKLRYEVYSPHTVSHSSRGWIIKVLQRHVITGQMNTSQMGLGVQDVRNDSSSLTRLSTAWGTTLVLILSYQNPQWCLNCANNVFCNWNSSLNCTSVLARISVLRIVIKTLWV